MKVNDDVILDLLPLYYEGEVSESTQKMIEDYFNEHPEFASQVDRIYSKMKKVLDEKSVFESDDENTSEEKMQTLLKTKKLLRIRTALLVFTVSTFVIVIFMATFSPTSFLFQFQYHLMILLLLSLFSFIGYFYVRKRMRTTQV